MILLSCRLSGNRPCIATMGGAIFPATGRFLGQGETLKVWQAMQFPRLRSIAIHHPSIKSLAALLS